MGAILRHRIRHLVSGCFLIVFVFIWAAASATSIGLQCQAAQAQTATVFPNLPPMNLTLIALNGTQLVLNSTDIASLQSVRGLGGYGTLDNYTGVPITTLCDLVGGINNDSVVKITASDNYSQTFSYDQIVIGNFTTAPHSQPLTLIIAYYKNDVNLTSQGPLMSAIIGSEDLLTDGHYWVWYTTEIQILNRTAVPEFQSFSVTLLLLATVATAMILLKKRSRLYRQGFAN